MKVRVGNGVDVHAFADDRGRRLVLGGASLPEGPGLAGHSDGDVVLHAITDALLGAAGLGDLGTLFGTEDPAYAGAPSSVFVEEALRRVRAGGWAVANVDVTILAQRPRLAHHRNTIVASVSGILGTAREEVGVKATTTDHLGFLGRAEGIACLATVLLTSG